MVVCSVETVDRDEALALAAAGSKGCRGALEERPSRSAAFGQALVGS